MKIFIVTSGEYSDYHIDGVFTDKGLAMIFTQKFGGDIEEWDANPFSKELRAGYSPFLVRMLENGDVSKVEVSTNSYRFIDGNTSWKPSWKDGQGNFCFYVLATDEKHAVKIANEKRTMILAQQ